MRTIRRRKPTRRPQRRRRSSNTRKQQYAVLIGRKDNQHRMRNRYALPACLTGLPNRSRDCASTNNQPVPRSLNEKCWPAIAAEYINPPLPTLKTAMPSFQLPSVRASRL
jgi:hypothetical protein